MKTTKSLKIEPEIWMDLKVHCAKKKMSMSLFIEKAIQDKMEEEDELPEM